ncbi:N-acetylmannosamine kinase [Vibrio paucivorans]
MHTLAIDIGGTKIALGVVSNGNIIERCQLPTPKAQSAEQFAHAILAHCQEWLAGVDKIGISTTGLVTEQGISAINPGTLAFPAPFPLHQELERLTDKPVAMLNDAQAAAWFEYLQLDGQYKNMAYVTVSTGVGGGLVIDGKLHTGASNLAGHIGHTVIDLNGPECGCGLKGCVEAVASGTAINKFARESIREDISNIELFELAKTDSNAHAIIERSAKAVATLCTNLKASCDLDAIVLGGGIGLAGNYIDLVRNEVANAPAPFQVPVFAAIGDYDACLLGAAFQF